MVLKIGFKKIKIKSKSLIGIDYFSVINDESFSSRLSFLWRIRKRVQRVMGSQGTLHFCFQPDYKPFTLAISHNPKTQLNLKHSNSTIPSLFSIRNSNTLSSVRRRKCKIWINCQLIRVTGPFVPKWMSIPDGVPPTPSPLFFICFQYISHFIVFPPKTWLTGKIGWWVNRSIRKAVDYRNPWASIIDIHKGSLFIVTLN